MCCKLLNFKPKNHNWSTNFIKISVTSNSFTNSYCFWHNKFEFENMHALHALVFMLFIRFQSQSPRQLNQTKLKDLMHDCGLSKILAEVIPFRLHKKVSRSIKQIFLLQNREQFLQRKIILFILIISQIFLRN